MPEKVGKICDMSTPSLAYLGDCVLELLVRERLTLSGISSSKNLNKEALRFVSAPAQAAAMKNILELLTEEEAGYFRRGRNIGHTNTPKNATVSEYRTATGMETLFGFLHLSDQKERARELFALAFPTSKENG
jgi:ribonuclease-3 family protein